MPQIRTIAVSGSVPTVNQLALGDIAINTVDGKVFVKKVINNIQTIVEITNTTDPRLLFDGDNYYLNFDP
jgi:hypothetical protein